MMRAATIGALSGQCLIYAAGADPPPPPLIPDTQSSAQNSPDQSTTQNRPGVPALRFKKEDFVPIPDMAPMPLDNPQPVAKKALQVNIPNMNAVEQAPPVHQVMLTPTPAAAAAPPPVVVSIPLSPAAPAAPPVTTSYSLPATTPSATPVTNSMSVPVTTIASAPVVKSMSLPVAAPANTPAPPASGDSSASKGFFGRLISHLNPLDDDDANKQKTGAATIQQQQLYSATIQAPTPPTPPAKPIAATLRHNFVNPPPANATIQSAPVAGIAQQDLVPPVDAVIHPTLTINSPARTQNFSALTPTAGPDMAAPLIPLTDPGLVATQPASRPRDTAIAASSPAVASEPLIALPSAAPPLPAAPAVAPPAAIVAAQPTPAVAPTPMPAPPVVAPMPKPLPAVAATPTPAPVEQAAAEPAPDAINDTPPPPPTHHAKHTTTTQTTQTTSSQSAPPPRALSSPLWNPDQAVPPPQQPLLAQAPMPQPLPWQTAAAPLSPSNPATYGASALPPPPTIATGSLGPPTMPDNIPPGAIQHWSGSNALPVTATNTLPAALQAPPPSPQAVYQPAPAQPAYAQRPLPAPSSYVPQPPPAPAVYAPPQPPVQTAQQALPETMQGDATEPRRSLSPESKQIVKTLALPNKGKEYEAAKPVFIEHAKSLTSLDAPQTPAPAQDAQGVKIEMKPPRMNFEYELGKAYNALMGGQTDVAIATYKNVLDNDPNNKNALFGLATTYHRAGQLELARPMYSRLLAIDPGNADGLNNFLVLLSDEAPEEALVELQKLAEHNPQYSALPAQIAVIYQKLGQFDKAGQYMFQAIEMAPENITYRYNFAIMLDKQHKYEEAAKLYRELIQAYQRGESIPGNIQKIQQRLTFISSNRPS